MSSKSIIKICTELKLALYGEVKNINLSTHHVTKLFLFRFQEKLKENRNNMPCLYVIQAARTIKFISIYLNYSKIKHFDL